MEKEVIMQQNELLWKNYVDYSRIGKQNSMGRHSCNMDCNVTYYVTSAALVHALP